MLWLISARDKSHKTADSIMSTKSVLLKILIGYWSPATLHSPRTRCTPHGN